MPTTDDPRVLRQQLEATAEALYACQRQNVQLTRGLQDALNDFRRQESFARARASVPPPPPPPADPEVAELMLENGELRRRIEDMRTEVERFKGECRAEVERIRQRETMRCSG